MTAFHDAVLPQPLTFAPPYAGLAMDPQGFSRFWQFAHYAFCLPDPGKFPPLVGEIDQRDSRTIARFIKSCRELAGYSIMSAHDSVTLKFNDGKPTHTSTFSSSESVRAAATLFRQLHGTDSGSYTSVRKIVSRLVNEHLDEDTERRREELAIWRRAIGRLMQNTIEAIVARLSLDSIADHGHSKVPIPFEDLRPLEVISIYLNGDLIHWGDRAEAHEAIQRRDPYLADLDKIHFLEAMAGLAHAYLGFSVLAGRALSIPTDGSES